MTVAKWNRSADDLCLNKSSSIQIDRRARSSSPVKNRHSLPPSFYGKSSPNISVSPDDLQSLISNSTATLSHDQLKSLSSSPLSKKLHISTSSESNKYVIPIPFTLQLPPKLSAKNQQQERSRPPSPSKSKSPRGKQTRLVYTGQGYKKLDSSSDSELDEAELNQKIALPRRPALSPIAKNKSKSTKFSFQTKILSHDELSIIEEVSNSTVTSRQPSVKSKSDERSLPPAPIDRSQTLRKPSVRGSDISSVKIKINQKNNESTIKNPPVSASCRELAYLNDNTVQYSALVDDRNTEHNSQSIKSNNNIQPVPSSYTRLITTSMPKSTTEDNLLLFQSSNTPIAIKNTILKINKRSFSDESQVSSVSSFSSFGDLLNFNRVPNQSNKAEESSPILKSAHVDKVTSSKSVQSSGFNRKVSNGSLSSYRTEKSKASNGSWDSVQKSIDISLGDDLSSENSPVSSNAHSESDLVSLQSANNSKKLPPLPSEEEIQPLRINRDPTLTEKGTESIKQQDKGFKGNDKFTNPNKNENMKSEIYKNEKSLKEDQLEVKIPAPTANQNIISTDSDSEGINKDFVFPNNYSNVTNSKQLRKKLLSSDSYKSSQSRFSYISSATGQIEIPDLNDDAVSHPYTSRKSMCSYNGSTFDDICSDISRSSNSEDDFDENSSKLEPIGVPTKASQNVIKEHIRMMYNDDDSDTDIDSTKFSLYSTTSKSRSSPCLSTEYKAELPYLPKKPSQQSSCFSKQLSSPIKHVRHKSMFNIDFSVNDAELSPTKSTFHSRSKSVDLNKFTSHLQPNTLTTAKVSETLEQNTESMKIFIEDPPSKVKYAVDFKEAAITNDIPQYSSSTPTINDIFNLPISYSLKNSHKEKDSFSKVMKTVGQTHDQPQLQNSFNYRISSKLRGDEVSSTSVSSYQSSRTAKGTNTTSPSDTNSVVIDLRKDKYDLCMIQRNNTTESYRSITEKTKDGKEVEVVLVDADEEDGTDDDELASIYSKYKNNSWVFRSDSTSSLSSSASTASFDSKVASETQLKLKPRNSLIAKYKQMNTLRTTATVVDQLQIKRSNRSSSSKTSSASVNYTSRRIKPPSVIKEFKQGKLPEEVAGTKMLSPANLSSYQIPIDSNYFDYTSAGKYDFSSFMKQKAASKPSQ